MGSHGVRKSVGGKAPRKGPELRCTYQNERNQGGNTSAPHDNDVWEPVADIPDCLSSLGFREYAQDVRPVDIPARALRCFDAVKGRQRFEALPADLRDVIQGRRKAYEVRHTTSGGQPSYSIFTNRRVLSGTPLLCYTGELYVKEAFMDKYPDAQDKSVHLWAFDLAQEDLKRDGYKGRDARDLVLAANIRGNEARFLHDPTWHSRTWPPQPNVGWDIIWTAAPSHRNQVLPYLFFRALKDLDRDTELLLFWGNGCWEALSQNELKGQAQVSWKMAGVIKKLQERKKALEEAASGPSGSGSSPAAANRRGPGGFQAFGAGPSGSSGQGARPSNGARPGTRQQEDFKFAFDVDSGQYLSAGRLTVEGLTASMPSRPGPLGRLPPPKERYRAVTDDQLKKACPGYMSEACLDKCFDGLPDKLLTHMTRSAFRKTAHTPERLSEEEEELVASGALPGTAVKEIASQHHLVRFLTPPDEKAFALMAAKDIKAGAAIGIYAGRVRLAKEMDLVNQPEREAYSYALERDVLSKARPNMQGWPRKGLVVDALEASNAARFMNDVWGEDETCEANVVGKAVWSERKQRPYIMMYADTDIKRGEELRVAYGKDYWWFWACCLQNAQAKYFATASAKIKELQENLRALEGGGDTGKARVAALMQEIDAAVDVAAKRLYDE